MGGDQPTRHGNNNPETQSAQWDAFEIGKRHSDNCRETDGRVGAPNDATQVKLKWADTFWALSGKKYHVDADGQLDACEAIYEANRMTPNVVMHNGIQELIAPTYYAGKTYTLPAQKDIDELRRKFWDRMEKEHGITRVPRPWGDHPVGPVKPPVTDGGTGTPPVKPPVTDGGTGNPPVKPPGTDGGNGTPKPPGTDGGTGTPPVKPPVTDGGNGTPKPPGTDGGNGTPKPPGTDGGTNPPPACDQKAALQKAAKQLANRHAYINSLFEKEDSEKGIWGSTWDGVKNNLGGSGTKGNAVGKLTANVIDSDLGSDAIRARFKAEEDQIKQLQAAADKGDLAAFNKSYGSLTGGTFDPAKPAVGRLKLDKEKAVDGYAQSQANGVEFITDTGALVAATALTRRALPLNLRSSMGVAMLSDAAGTGLMKAGLKGVDSLTGDKKWDWQHDMLSGGSLGLLAAPGEAIGGLASKGTVKLFGERFGIRLAGEEATPALARLVGVGERKGVQLAGQELGLMGTRISTDGLGFGLKDLGRRSVASMSKYGIGGTAFGALAPYTQEAADATLDGFRGKSHNTDWNRLWESSKTGMKWGFGLGSVSGLLARDTGARKGGTTPDSGTPAPDANTGVPAPDANAGTPPADSHAGTPPADSNAGDAHSSTPESGSKTGPLAEVEALEGKVKDFRDAMQTKVEEINGTTDQTRKAILQTEYDLNMKDFRKLQEQLDAARNRVSRMNNNVAQADQEASRLEAALEAKSLERNVTDMRNALQQKNAEINGAKDPAEKASLQAQYDQQVEALRKAQEKLDAARAVETNVTDMRNALQQKNAEINDAKDPTERANLQAQYDQQVEDLRKAQEKLDAARAVVSGFEDATPEALEARAKVLRQRAANGRAYLEKGSDAFPRGNNADAPVEAPQANVEAGNAGTTPVEAPQANAEAGNAGTAPVEAPQANVEAGNAGTTPVEAPQVNAEAGNAGTAPVEVPPANVEASNAGAPQTNAGTSAAPGNPNVISTGDLGLEPEHNTAAAPVVEAPEAPGAIPSPGVLAAQASEAPVIGAPQTSSVRPSLAEPITGTPSEPVAAAPEAPVVEKPAAPVVAADEPSSSTPVKADGVAELERLAANDDEFAQHNEQRLSELRAMLDATNQPVQANAQQPAATTAPAEVQGQPAPALEGQVTPGAAAPETPAAPAESQVEAPGHSAVETQPESHTPTEMTPKELADLHESIGRAEEDVTTIRGEIESLNQWVKELKAESGKAAELSKVESDIADWTNELQKAEDTVARLRAQLPAGTTAPAAVPGVEAPAAPADAPVQPAGAAPADAPVQPAGAPSEHAKAGSPDAPSAPEAIALTPEEIGQLRARRVQVRQELTKLVQRKNDIWSEVKTAIREAEEKGAPISSDEQTRMNRRAADESSRITNSPEWKALHSENDALTAQLEPQGNAARGGQAQSAERTASPERVQSPEEVQLRSEWRDLHNRVKTLNREYYSLLGEEKRVQKQIGGLANDDPAVQAQREELMAKQQELQGKIKENNDTVHRIQRQEIEPAKQRAREQGIKLQPLLEESSQPVVPAKSVEVKPPVPAAKSEVKAKPAAQPAPAEVTDTKVTKPAPAAKAPDAQTPPADAKVERTAPPADSGTSKPPVEVEPVTSALTLEEQLAQQKKIVEIVGKRGWEEKNTRKTIEELKKLGYIPADTPVTVEARKGILDAAQNRAEALEQQVAAKQVTPEGEGPATTKVETPQAPAAVEPQKVTPTADGAQGTVESKPTVTKPTEATEPVARTPETVTDSPAQEAPAKGPSVKVEEPITPAEAPVEAKPEHKTPGAPVAETTVTENPITREVQGLLENPEFGNDPQAIEAKTQELLKDQNVDYKERDGLDKKITPIKKKYAALRKDLAEQITDPDERAGIERRLNEDEAEELAPLQAKRGPVAQRWKDRAQALRDLHSRFDELKKATEIGDSINALGDLVEGVLTGDQGQVKAAEAQLRALQTPTETAAPAVAPEVQNPQQVEGPVHSEAQPVENKATTAPAGSDSPTQSGNPVAENAATRIEALGEEMQAILDESEVAGRKIRTLNKAIGKRKVPQELKGDYESVDDMKSDVTRLEGERTKNSQRIKEINEERKALESGVEPTTIPQSPKGTGAADDSKAPAAPSRQSADATTVKSEKPVANSDTPVEPGLPSTENVLNPNSLDKSLSRWEKTVGRLARFVESNGGDPAVAREKLVALRQAHEAKNATAENTLWTELEQDFNILRQGAE